MRAVQMVDLMVELSAVLWAADYKKNEDIQDD